MRPARRAQAVSAVVASSSLSSHARLSFLVYARYYGSYAVITFQFYKPRRPARVLPPPAPRALVPSDVASRHFAETIKLRSRVTAVALRTIFRGTMDVFMTAI